MRMSYQSIYRNIFDLINVLINVSINDLTNDLINDTMKMNGGVPWKNEKMKLLNSKRPQAS